MAIERKFVNKAIKKIKVGRFLRKELDSVGCGTIEVKRTPLGTRILIESLKPGLVVGRKGKTIQALTNTLEEVYKIDNPQIEVQEVKIPEFNPKIMAESLSKTIERGIHFRRAAYNMLYQIMNAGALGVQIEVSGKISGARARHEKFKEGYIKHCGETADLYVKEATTEAHLKAGVIGIKVKIAPPLEQGAFRELSIKEKVESEVKKEEAKEVKKTKESKKDAEEKVSEKKAPTKEPKKAKGKAKKIQKLMEKTKKSKRGVMSKNVNTKKK